MSPPPQLRVVLVGRDLSIKPLEDVLTRQGASNYICVPSIDAADWLIRDGFDADLLIVHHALLSRPADLAALRRQNPQAIVLPTAALCDDHEVCGALTAASRRRQRRASERRTALPTFLGALGRRVAWS